MKALLHKILYRTLPLEGYLRAVSRLFFISYRLGLGRRSAATEYVYHLPRLAKAGDTAIDIGANLGYYARPSRKSSAPQAESMPSNPYRSFAGCCAATCGAAATSKSSTVRWEPRIKRSP